MALTQEFYGELFPAGHWADTTQRSVVVRGSDGAKRYVEFLVHGGTATVDLVSAPLDPEGVQAVEVTAYIYTTDGALERTVALLNTWAGLDAHGARLLTNSQAIYAAAGADFIASDSTGGYAYVLYGPGVECSTSGPYAEFTPMGNPTVTVTRNAKIYSPNTSSTGGDPAAAIQAEIDRVNPILTNMYNSVDTFFAEENFDIEIYHNVGFTPVRSQLLGKSEVNVTGTGFRLYRINVATGAVTDVTPAFMVQQFTADQFLVSKTVVLETMPPSTAITLLTWSSGYVEYNFSVPPSFYKQFFYACTSSLLAHGNNVWFGHAEPSLFPATPAELSRFTGGTVSAPGTPERITDLTYPTSTTQLSGQPIINHQMGARHPPMEAFNYVYEALGAGLDLTISNSQHLVSQVHPSRLPSQDSSVFKWAWTVDNAGTPQGQIPDVSGVGERYTMVSGCVAVDTPFLFANTQRGVTVTTPTEEVPNPPPSATQFVVPIRDGSGCSKDWRWYQNMAGTNQFYGVPSGIIHLYLVDPVARTWKYMGPAKEATGAAGTMFTTTGADGPFLTSQRTSRVVNLNGVLACTSLFGAMKPTMANTLRSEQDGSSSAYPASALSAVGFTEELWLVCSNDGTNWVKVAKLTEPLQTLAAGKEGDSVSLKAGTTKLIGYGPRNLPIASAPCLIRKPII